MLEQILANMHIDAELLAELDDEQKQVLFFKMREEQVRRWKKWQSELEEDQIKLPFIATKPKREANLKVRFATEADGKPVVVMINDDDLSDDAGRDSTKTVVTKEVCKFEATKKQDTKPVAKVDPARDMETKPVAKVDPVREPKAKPVTKDNSVAKQTTYENLQAEKSNQVVLDVLNINYATVTADDGSVLDTIANDQQELDWQNSLKKSKEHDEMRRIIARMIRMSLSDKPSSDSVPSSNSNVVTESQNVQPATDDLSGKMGGAAVKPPPPARPNWMKSSKPTCRDDIIAWFQNVEEKRNAMSDVNGPSVAVWFHGVITRDEAENYLNGQRIGSFLVRVSERVWGYVVSYLGTRTDQLHGVVIPQVKHYLVDAGTRGYRFFGADRLTHPSLSDLVKHHLKNPISLTGNEVLKYPVGQTRDIPDYSDLFTNFSQSEEISHL